MLDILYQPHLSPVQVSPEGLRLPDPVTLLATVPPQVPELLGCAAEMVDVLATGSTYVAHSVFDFEGPVNLAAMTALTKVSGTVFDINDDYSVLRGPVLLVTS